VDDVFAVDLRIDLKTMDETGLPRVFLDQALNLDPRFDPGVGVVAGLRASDCAPVCLAVFGAVERRVGDARVL